MAASSKTESLQIDYARCSAITRKSSSNFYYAFMLLPKPRRRALYAVYAFCRFLDDVADGGAARDPAALLRRWREELDRVYAGTPTRPISRALADAARRFNLPRKYFEEFIAGVEMDLTCKRYKTFDDLYRYCYRVAATVGLICIEIFGYRNQATKVYAEKLGVACQLTNILRDVREDASRKRIYLPLEDLQRFDVSEDEILTGKHSDRFERLMAFEAARAQHFYQEAVKNLPREDRRTLLTSEAMRLIYHAILRSIERSRYRVMDRRHGLSAPRKLFLVGRAWVLGHLSLVKS